MRVWIHINLGLDTSKLGFAYAFVVKIVVLCTVYRIRTYKI